MNLAQENTVPQQFGHLIGQSHSMQSVYHLIQKVAPAKATVLITGESGTGKELVAKSIHDLSDRAKGPFIAINCGAISKDLINSALFGHEKGSFTGAYTAHQGYFEQASGGTLFLDELSETSADLQIKLLRVLETGTVIPVGGKRQIHVNVRVIVAMNRNPFIAVNQGILRKDLYYRINTFPITLPKLKDRGNDIEILAQDFLKQCNTRYQRHTVLSKNAIAYLYTLAWEGNVRELKNAIQRAFLLADNIIKPEHFTAFSLPTDFGLPKAITIPLGSSLQEVEQAMIKATLHQTNHNVKQTAHTLGIPASKVIAYVDNYPDANRVAKAIGF